MEFHDPELSKLLCPFARFRKVEGGRSQCSHALSMLHALEETWWNTTMLTPWFKHGVNMPVAFSSAAKKTMLHNRSLKGTLIWAAAVETCCPRKNDVETACRVIVKRIMAVDFVETIYQWVHHGRMRQNPVTLNSGVFIDDCSVVTTTICINSSSEPLNASLQRQMSSLHAGNARHDYAPR